MIKKAMFSLYDTRQSEEFANRLVNLGWQIIATEETETILKKKGIPVTGIGDFLGESDKYPFPPTLHPRMELYLTTDDADRIDLVYINPYPLFTGNDVGGRTLLALAAKGNRVPVMLREDMIKVINVLEEKGEVQEVLKSELQDKVHASIVRHYLSLISSGSSHRGLLGTKTLTLMNGENPYQVPSNLYGTDSNDPLALTCFEQISGEKPCFTNLADTDCLVQTLCLISAAFENEFEKIPFISIASKHGNACGLAISWDDPAASLQKALFGNPNAIWGGEFIANYHIEKDMADMLLLSDVRKEKIGNPKWMLDVVAAPSLSESALNILGRRKRRKILCNPALADPNLNSSSNTIRCVRGGFLSQPPNNYVIDLSKGVMIGSQLSVEQKVDILIAWSVAWSASLGGNEIAIASSAQLLAAGGGPSTVEAATVAVNCARRVGHEVNNCVFAANAFFPFTDAPEILVGVKATAGIVPAGGLNEKSVRRFFKNKGISVCYLPEQYRGFSRH